MSQDLQDQRDGRFLEICLELKLLQAEAVDTLRSEIGTSGAASVSETVVQRGLVTPADVDIVLSLLKPDEVVPGYKILELIGRGGMGVVYRAEQIDLERIIALKTILISKVNDSTVAARFEREAKALARLQHPNIVQALNFGQHQGRYYLAMELVTGRTCEQAVRDRGIIPADEVWSIVRQVASGLLHALGQNLIHRDIKPANLIMVPPPEGSASGIPIVKITDFGLAMFADQSPEQLKLTTGDKIMGSPAYMSLEQFGGRVVDFRSDIYSLGATAWHLLFGSPPFRGSNIATLYQAKSTPLVVDSAQLGVSLPDNQMRLLLGMLDPDPDLRPGNYRQLIDAIDALGVCKAVSPIAMSTAEMQSEVATSQQPTMLSAPPASQTPPQLDSVEKPLSSTIELPDSDAGTVRAPRRFRWTIAGAAIAVMLVVVGWMQTRPPTRGPRSYTRVFNTTPLFDGVTLSGWDVGGSMVGAWNTVEAPDDSTAIACTTQRGALTRRLPATTHPRIGLFVWIARGGGPVDIDFALESSVPSDVRGCLRISATKNELGEKDSDFGELSVATESPAFPTVHDRYHVVHIERQPSDWYVFLEERLIGTLPISTVGEGNAIRLVVHGQDSRENAESKAFFADAQLYDLTTSDN